MDRAGIDPPTLGPGPPGSPGSPGGGLTPGDGPVRPHRRSPLWASLALTWTDNLGATAVIIGIFFIATEAYGFSAAQNMLLGLAQGLTYIAAALTAGPGMRALAGPGRRISTRTLLALLHLALFAACLVPLLWRSPWAIWLLVAIYAPMTGWLWPAIESYLASGRRGEELRRASGGFNLAWASCQVVTFWAIAPFIKTSPLLTVPIMGCSHLVAVVFVFLLRPEPAPHGEAGHHHDAAEYDRYKALLGRHRTLLVLSYVVYSALNPLLPQITDRLGIAVLWRTPLTSVWMISRVVSFWFMGWWGGWHGRTATLIWPSILLLTGFALCLLAPTPWVLGTGLAVFGVGMGAIYSAAFYYAMEVGSAGVDAGGKHEALIGLGYTAGPLLGLTAGGVAAAAWVPGWLSKEVALALAVLLVGAVGALLLLVRGVRRPR